MSERVRSLQLGVDKMLALEARVSELEAENAKLRKCVEIVDQFLRDGPCFCEEEVGYVCALCSMTKSYDAARSEVNK